MMMRRVSLIVTFSLWLLSTPVLSQTQKPQNPNKFPPNPLEIIVPDPLLPRKPNDKRPLTIQEQQDLEVALDKLNLDAAAKLQAGDKDAAYDTWNREIRLRRYLGNLAEVQALSRVGEIAWQANERPEVQYVTERLQSIQKPKKSTKLPPVTDVELLQALGEAYQKLRSPQLALEVYKQILISVRQQQNSTAEIEMLKTIGTVEMNWFDYTKAAATYEELLGLASAKGERINEVAYLQQLAYIYEQARQTQQTINARSKLVDIYLKDNNLAEIPGLKIAIASDYETLAKQNPSLLQNAFQNYEEAYTTAWEQQQYVRAGEALQKLIALYRSQGQIDEALQTSQILLQTQELAGNFYDLMNTYDQIGQIYVQRKEYQQARNAFEAGLKIAQQLKQQESYFTEQIKKIPT